MALEYESLTETIIGAAIEVHRTLGPGFLESIYRKAMVIELREQGLQVAEELEVPVFYDGIEVGRHRLDLLVEDTIVTELKTVRTFENVHFAIVKSYLRPVERKHGLLLNFARLTVEAKRVIAG